MDGMLIATFIADLFYAASYPFIHKEIMMVAPDYIIAVTQIINCLSIIIFGFLWNKNSEKLFKFYPLYCCAETLLGICTTIFAITTHHIVAYYIMDTLIFAIVTRNICCGGVKLKAIRYTTEDKREHFDNNNASASAIATIIGSTVAMLLSLSFPIMLCIATFGNAIDNIFYICIFIKTNKCRN